mmetsp:Transcript_3841/g.12415  ORF Transcript_3841/g.12415 Transcript_3841/m.12415 type:complete len:592 (-) Transcript_3841:81-1856(-)
MILSLAVALSTSALVVSAQTPAPTYMGHQQLFDKVRAEEQLTRDALQKLDDYQPEALTQQDFADTGDALLAKYEQLAQRLIELDVQGSTGTPVLVASVENELYSIAADGTATFLSEITADPAAGEDARHTQGNAPVWEPGFSASVIASWDPEASAVDNENGRLWFRNTWSVDEPAGGLLSLSGDQGICPGLNVTFDADGLAFDFENSLLYATTRDSADHEGNSCELVSLTPSCEKTVIGHYNDTHFDFGFPDPQGDQICKIPGLSYAPKPEPTLYGVTYWCEIIIVNTTNPGESPVFVDLIAEAILPATARCKRPGLAYDCLTNELHLLVQPSEVDPVQLVTLDGYGGGLISIVDTNLPTKPAADNDDPRFGYGLASVSCYKIDFVQSLINASFADIGFNTWEHAANLTLMMEQGFANLDNITVFAGNQTVDVAIEEGANTRETINSTFYPIQSDLERLVAIINSTVGNITDAYEGIDNSSVPISELGPQVEFWIDNFDGVGSVIDAFTFETMTDARENLLDCLTTLRFDVERRHSFILETALNVESVVAENGQRVSEQLLALELAYSDHSRFNDDDDDDNGLGTSQSTLS